MSPVHLLLAALIASNGSGKTLVRSHPGTMVPVARKASVLAGYPLGAFPGCEGSGCETRGGLSTSAGTPTVYRITSLADGTGAGTLGQCIAASGPRVCLFAVGGTINTAGYPLVNPYITIDGRTAPGDGIQLSGEGTTPTDAANYELVRVRTNNVVVRGVRFRSGWSNTYSHSFGFWAGSASDDMHHAVLDHNSFAYGMDGNLNVRGGNAAAGAVPAQMPRQITISYNILAEGVNRGGIYGSRALAIGGGNNAYADPMVDIDIHHNFYSSNMHRHPLFAAKSTRIVNNILHNWRWWGIDTTCGAQTDVVSNLGKLGPSYTRSGYIGAYITDHGDSDCASGTTSTYLSGNKYSGDETVYGWGTSIITADATATAAQYQRATPLAAPSTGPAITTVDASTLPTLLLGDLGVGASYRLDCGGRKVANRDAADTRVAVTQWASLPSYTWDNMTSPAAFGGWPVLASISSACAANSRDNAACVCADTDTDGLPDYWEAWKCGSATGCGALSTYSGTSWTYLDAFLSGLVEAP